MTAGRASRPEKKKPRSAIQPMQWRPLFVLLNYHELELEVVEKAAAVRDRPSEAKGQMLPTKDNR